MAFDEKYKALRNFVRNFDLDDLVMMLVMYLREFDINGMERHFEQKRPIPWLLLMLLKMAFLYAGENNKKKKPTPNDIIRMYNELHDLDGEYQMAFFQKDSAEIYLTSTALRQFWLQGNAYSGDFARVFFIFCQGNSGPIERLFNEQYGINLTTFVEMMLCVYVIIMQHPEKIFFRYSDVFESLNYCNSDIACFLSLVARDKDEVKKEIKSHQIIRSDFLLFGEVSPFWRFPFLRSGYEDLIVYCRRVLERALTFIPFEFVKELGGDAALDYLGERFGLYVAGLLGDACNQFIDEKTLEHNYGGKKTDFLIVENDTAVMIEAKSVRLGPVARANPVSSLIFNDLEDNVVKAIKQGHELSKRLAEKGAAQNFYLLVVTYDDMYLGTPSRAWDVYFKEYFEAGFASGDIEQGPLPYENIFIISINEFEELCVYSKAVGGFTDILDKAVENNRAPETAKFSLSLSFPIGIDVEGLDNFISDNSRAVIDAFIKRQEEAAASRNEE